MADGWEMETEFLKDLNMKVVSPFCPPTQLRKDLLMDYEECKLIQAPFSPPLLK